MPSSGAGHQRRIDLSAVLRHLGNARSEEFFTGERCHITELLNSVDVPDLSVARARVEPGVTTERHVLDVAETYLIEAGEGVIHGAGGLDFPVGPGDAIAIPAGASQSITNTGPGDLVFLCLCRPRFSPAGYRSLEPEGY
jgi:mannose-6-phosphate isomerase-like protein (cupin superfamily)